MLAAAAARARAGIEMLAAAAAGVEVGVGNAVVGEAGAGVEEGITNKTVDTAAAILVEGTCARRIFVSEVRTIRIVKIVLTISLGIVTTPLFLLPTINCINGRNAECLM
jgi:hypothetical protein